MESELLKSRETILKILLFLLLCVATGTVFYHFVESFSWLNSLYFSAMTLTTVGYGDFAPATTAGKLFTAVYAFLGIGFFFGFAGILFNHGVVRTARYHFRRRETKQKLRRQRSAVRRSQAATKKS
jgi:voltage-gated potassium channel Kch